MHPKKRPKVLFLIRSLNVGGAERQLIELAGGLRRAGVDVKLATFYDGGTLKPALAAHGVPHISLRKRGRWNVVRFLCRLVALIRSERPDIVYSMLTMSNVVLGLIAPFVRPAHVVWGVASSDMDESLYDWLASVETALEVRLAKRAELIICNSYAGRDWHVTRGYPRERTAVICNGIDTAHFRPDAVARRDVRAEWDVAEHERLVGIVARLDPIKDHANFLRAARLVADSRQDVRFVCVGGGPSAYREQLAALARELGISERVRWVAERTDIWRVYNALDLLVSSSISEGLANVIGEAMATDVRCVATTAGDSALLIANPRWLAPPQDSAALARAACNGLDDAPDAPGTQRARIVAGYGLAGLVDRTLAAFDEVLERRTAPRRPSPVARPAGAEAAPKIMLLTRRLDVGGAQRQLVELAKGLHAMGWPVCVTTFYSGGALASNLEEAGVPTVSLRKKGRWDVVGFALRLIALTRRERPAIVHGYLDSSNVMLVLLKPFLRAARIVWGVRASNMDLSQYDRLSRVEGRLAQALARRADLIICNSEAGRTYHAAMGYPAERMIVIPNGVDTSRYRPDARARAELRREWGVGENQPLIGIAARLDPMKDHRNFLHAALRVAGAEPHARFVCVGDGPAGYREALRKEAVDLGLADRIVWAGVRHDMWRVYNAFDVAVSSSSYGEGFPNTVLESMATGLTCVVTDVGDSAAIVGPFGCVCPPRDDAALAAAILHALAVRGRDAQRIREHVTCTYGSPMLVRRTAVQLERLLAGNSPVGRDSIGEMQ